MQYYEINISIHALREEGDCQLSSVPSALLRFLSTPSARRATPALARFACMPSYFYPRPPRGGRRQRYGDRILWQYISIHALREEGDSVDSLLSHHDPISIHALREEGDLGCAATSEYSSNFYPRPPRGGRHLEGFNLDDNVKFLSTPSARRATFGFNGIRKGIGISIHALREEGDGSRWTVPHSQDISIHALREEGDPSGQSTAIICSYFYPRPPRGGRRLCRKTISKPFGFLSTPSARRATDSAQSADREDRISIHALREEGDVSETTSDYLPKYFYPRPPRGGRRGIKGGIAKGGVFLSTPSARRATPVMLATPDRSTISIHALREEGDVRL